VIRRLILVGLGAVLAAPAFSVTPAAATVLFSCPSIDTIGLMRFSPGLGHTQTAQTMGSGGFGISDPCSNGETADVGWDGYNLASTYPPRPLNCPWAWAPHVLDPNTVYPDQTPLLFGPDGGPSAFGWRWAIAGDSHGIFKAKAGPNSDFWRFVFNITSGAYAPPAGKKTKVKFTEVIKPYPGESLQGCADDSDLVNLVSLDHSVSSVIVQQV
jgi:hypothetical protein